jgi:hypothetical protein
MLCGALARSSYVSMFVRGFVKFRNPVRYCKSNSFIPLAGILNVVL